MSAVGQAVLTLAAVGVLLGACSDYTDYSIKVQIKNDLTKTVRIKQCGDSCSSTEASQVLAPGQSTDATAAQGASNPWLVEEPPGNVVGCLPLTFGNGFKGASTEVLVSQTVPARRCH